MAKISFAIIGSGWRAAFYIRIARAYSEKYELTGVYCRSQEKAELIKKEYEVFATDCESDIIESHPDFIVVAVSKPSIAEVSSYWRGLGFTVLCETPVALNKEDLLKINNMVSNPDKKFGELVVAEQYVYYPTYRRIIETVESGIIGEPVSVHVSLAHEYHGASLIRAMLKEKFDAPYRLLCTKYDLPVAKTKDRYNAYFDGEVINRSKAVAIVEFEDGKVGTYDFDSEQYRSPIRHNFVKITGVRGEIINERLWYLDENNKPQEKILFEDISLARESGIEGALSEDELAIEYMMEMTYKVSMGDVDAKKWQEINLKNAISDAEFMLAMQKSQGEFVCVDMYAKNE